MGVNPMQKMKKNSILTGLLIGLLIGLVLCVILYIFLTGSGKNIKKGEAKTVQVLAANVKSGETISVANIVTKTMSIGDTPADAVSISQDVIAKIDLTAGTILTSGMLNMSENTLTNDLREQEYNMISLPTNLTTGDFIDIRLQLPNGGDYIVISKKKVLNCNSTTVWLNMNEEEILTMSNAIIEYYIMAGSKLYATKYTEPGMQKISTPTYCPNSEVVELINGDKNITSQIIDGEGRFSEKLKNIRNSVINKELNKYSDTNLENIEKNLQEEIKNLKATREAWFGSANAVQSTVK